MSEFTYVAPNEQMYRKAVLLALVRANRSDLRDILKNAKCTINISEGYFSRSRWNAYYTSIIFQIPMSEYESLNIEEEDKSLLKSICDGVMPPDAGLDVMHVDITPLLYEEDAGSLQQDLEQITDSLQSLTAEFTLPDDILVKGKEMAEAYLYLYAAENYLRLFIEKVASNQFGLDYFNNLKISTDVKKGIAIRKAAETKNNWMSIRGGSDLFYLDFSDIDDIIINNWELFKSYFPGQAWISSKITELGHCRNLVAHNSYLGAHEKDVIRVNFNSIIRQLNPHME